MTTKDKMVGVTVRLPIDDDVELRREAEERGMSRSDILRERFQSSQYQKTLDDHLRQLEHRILRKVFVLTCAIHGLGKDEAKQANERYKAFMRGDED